MDFACKKFFFEVTQAGIKLGIHGSDDPFRHGLF